MRRTSLSTSLRRTEGWAVNKASQIHLRGLWRLWAWKRRASAMRVDGGLAIAAPTKSATWGTTAALDSARVLFSGQRGEKIREICEQVASDGPSRLERSVRSSRLCGHVVGGPWATRRPRCRVALGGCPPRAPTDPGVRNYRTRLVRTRLCYAANRCTMRGRGSGKRSSSARMRCQSTYPALERRESHFCQMRRVSR